jgi:hypothetical protein
VKRALVAIVGVLASFGAMYAICTHLGANISPAILAAALAVGLARRPQRFDARETLVRLATLPLVALAAGIVGLTIRALPPLGAVLFCAGITLSIWLRNFGERASAVGRTIALPFIAMLVVPLRPETSLGPVIGALLVIAAGVIAIACTMGVQWIVDAIGLGARAA